MDSESGCGELPPGWEVRTSRSGRLYFYDRLRLHSQWHRPDPQASNWQRRSRADRRWSSWYQQRYNGTEPAHAADDSSTVGVKGSAEPPLSQHRPPHRGAQPPPAEQQKLQSIDQQQQYVARLPATSVSDAVVPEMVGRASNSTVADVQARTMASEAAADPVAATDNVASQEAQAELRDANEAPGRSGRYHEAVDTDESVGTDGTEQYLNVLADRRAPKRRQLSTFAGSMFGEEAAALGQETATALLAVAVPRLEELTVDDLAAGLRVAGMPLAQYAGRFVAAKINGALLSQLNLSLIHI